MSMSEVNKLGLKKNPHMYQVRLPSTGLEVGA